MILMSKLTGDRAMCRDHVSMKTVSLFKRVSEVLNLGGVHDGLPGLHLEVLMDIMVKMRGVLASIIVHHYQLGQDIPGHISMKVAVARHQLGDDEDMNSGVEMLQFLDRKIVLEMLTQNTCQTSILK